jgi:hypothetical protein
VKLGRVKLGYGRAPVTATPSARPAPAPRPVDSDAIRARFRSAIVGHFFLRSYMSLIVGAAMGAGILVSKLLLMIGLHRLWLRYGLAVLISYAVFLVLVRLWLAYIRGGFRPGRGAGQALDAGDGLDLPVWSGGGGSGGVSGGNAFQSGGGQFGGGGASGSFDGAAVTSGGGSGGGGGGGGGGFDLDLDDGIWVVIAVALLTLVVAGAGAYVIWAAPDILSEALFQVVLAGHLARPTGRIAAEGWTRSVVHATIIPLLCVVLVAGFAGGLMQWACPSAVSIRSAVSQCVLSTLP